MGPAQVGEGVVELAEGEVGLAPVVVGERRERVRAGQLGRRDRQVELGDRLGVGALLGEAAAAVGADAHDLGDVAGALGVGEGELVVAGVGRRGPPAGRRASPAPCRPWPARRRRRCAGRSPAPARRTVAPVGVARAQRITERQASTWASSAGSLPSRVPAAHTSSASSRRPRRYNRPARLRASAVVGHRAGRRLGVRRSGVVPLAALVGEVAAQLGERGGAAARARRRQGRLRGVGGASQSGCSIASSDLAGPPGRRPGAEHEGVLGVAGGAEQPHDAASSRSSEGGGNARRTKAPPSRRGGRDRAAEHRFEEDPLRRQPGEVGGEVAAADVVEQAARTTGTWAASTSKSRSGSLRLARTSSAR